MQDDKYFSRNFGLFVKHQRKRQRMTMNLLAERSGLSRFTIAKIEAGNTGVSLENAGKLMLHLGTSFSGFERFLNSDSIRSTLAGKFSKNSKLVDKVMSELEEL